MGLASSPYIATMAMKYTFSDDVLEKFKEEHNYADLPFSRFDQFLSFYLDDCLIYTPKELNCLKYNSRKLHLIYLEAVIYTLHAAGWIASLAKANFLSDKLVFLGKLIDTRNDTSKIQPNRVTSIVIGVIGDTPRSRLKWVLE